MIDLNTFISSEFVKNEITSAGAKVIHDVKEADQLIFDIIDEKPIRHCIVFERSFIKNYFFSKIDKLIPETSIINCNSHIDRFCENLQDSENLIIFDNVNSCRNTNILNIIKNKNGILVC